MSRRNDHPSSLTAAPSSSGQSAYSQLASGNVTITHAPMERSSDRAHRRDTQGESSRQAQATTSSDLHLREDARQAIVSSLVQILEQPLGMLRNGIVSDAQMASESKLIPGSTLGKHLRHVHDHYRVLLDSIEAQRTPRGSPAALSLDYDKRMSIPPLETSAKAAISEFESTQQRVHALLGEGAQSGSAAEADLDRPVQLSATTPNEVELGSTLGREMWFVCLHAIHHYALARVILVHELGCKIDDSFGVAPSTLVLRAWRQAAASASESSTSDSSRHSKL